MRTPVSKLHRYTIDVVEREKSEHFISFYMVTFVILSEKATLRSSNLLFTRIPLIYFSKSPFGYGSFFLQKFKETSNSFLSHLMDRNRFSSKLFFYIVGVWKLIIAAVEFHVQLDKHRVGSLSHAHMKMWKFSLIFELQASFELILMTRNLKIQLHTPSIQ